MIGFVLKTPEEIEQVKENIRLKEEEQMRLKLEAQQRRYQQRKEREERAAQERAAQERAAQERAPMNDQEEKIQQEVNEEVNKMADEAGVGNTEF